MTLRSFSNTLPDMSDSLLRGHTGTPAHTTDHRKASASIRIALAFYALLVVYASCYPFAGWRDNGLLPWTYLGEPMPRYWTWFDLGVNVLGYIPLTALMTMALYPRLRGLSAALVAFGGGLLIAVLLEALQSYLPSRVPSNLDLLTNAAGALSGAALGTLLCGPVLEQSRLRALRRAWFSEQASRGLIVVALWPLAQLYPQPYLFGLGQVLPTVSGWLSSAFDLPLDLSRLVWGDVSLSVDQYLLAELIITACGMTGAVLTLLSQTRRSAPRVLLAVALMLAAVSAKAVASAVLFAPDDAFAWLTPAAASGLLVGAVMLGGLLFAPPLAQRRAAMLALVVALVLLNVAPANPYFLATLQEWVQGKFLNFNGAAQFLSLSWPLFALWFLTHPTHRSS